MKLHHLLTPMFTLTVLIASATFGFADSPRPTVSQDGSPRYQYPIPVLPSVPPAPPIPGLPPLPAPYKVPVLPPLPPAPAPLPNRILPQPVQPSPNTPIVPEKPPVPLKPIPTPLPVSPVAFDFETTAPQPDTSPDGEKCLTFQVKVKIDYAKDRKLLLMAALTDKSNKPILDETGAAISIPCKLMPDTDQSEQTIDFRVPRSELEKRYGSKAKEFHLEIAVLDFTEVKDFEDPKELAKAKVIGTAPAVFHLAIPGENEKPTKPLQPTDVLKYRNNSGK